MANNGSPGGGLQPRRVDGYLPIECYAAIGDGRSLALVGIDGSIDWMCLPNLDGPSVFAAVLDPAQGGSFSLAPAGTYSVKRSYLPRTNVLVTEFTAPEGAVRVTETFTFDSGEEVPWCELVRQVEGITGTVPMQWRLRPSFEYGQSTPDPVHRGGAWVYRHGDLQVGLRCWDAGEPQADREAVHGRFEVSAGERALLALLASDDVSLVIPERRALEYRLRCTVDFWRAWLGRLRYDGPWKGAVERSLLALRLLADRRTGAITAAGTTSLPEQIGGERNYDYRFAWVRDLCFTVEALLRVGMEELAHTSINWLFGAIENTLPRIDPVYGLTGEVVRGQEQLPLAGYRGSAPVHIGNQAGSQLQLGGFGDLVETVWRHAEAGHLMAPRVAERIADSVDLLAHIWRNEDAGLWELGDYAQYATSKLSCWTAFERGLDLVRRGDLPRSRAGHWPAVRSQIRDFIETSCWSDRRRSYVMKAGSEMLDCGVLLAARRNFTDPKGPRMQGTIEAIRSELRAEGPLFYRYSGMQEQENAFLACSFWLAEALALAGRQEEAGELLDGMVALANDVGLYSEEMEPGGHAMRGNFPQALTHLALINAAVLLEENS